MNPHLRNTKFDVDDYTASLNIIGYHNMIHTLEPNNEFLKEDKSNIISLQEKLFNYATEYEHVQVRRKFKHLHTNNNVQQHANENT